MHHNQQPIRFWNSPSLIAVALFAFVIAANAGGEGAAQKAGRCPTKYDVGCYQPYQQCIEVQSSKCTSNPVGTLMVRSGTGLYYFYHKKNSKCYEFNVQQIFNQNTQRPPTNESYVYDAFSGCEQTTQSLITCTQFYEDLDEHQCVVKRETFDLSRLVCQRGNPATGIVCSSDSRIMATEGPCEIRECAYEISSGNPEELVTVVPDCCSNNQQCGSSDQCQHSFCDTTADVHHRSGHHADGGQQQQVQNGDMCRGKGCHKKHKHDHQIHQGGKPPHQHKPKQLQRGQPEHAKEGICRTVQRDCAADRCVEESILRGPCAQTCLENDGDIIDAMCDDYVQYIALIWQGMHNGTENPLDLAQLVFPNCPGSFEWQHQQRSDTKPKSAPKSRKGGKREQIPLGVECHRCVLGQLSATSLNPQVQECVCDSMRTCDDIETQCRAGGPVDSEMQMCQTICKLKEEHCLSECALDHALAEEGCVEEYSGNLDICEQNYLHCQCEPIRTRGGKKGERGHDGHHPSGCKNCDEAWEECMQIYHWTVDNCTLLACQEKELCGDACELDRSGCQASCRLGDCVQRGQIFPIPDQQQVLELNCSKKSCKHHGHNDTTAQLYDGCVLACAEEQLVDCNQVCQSWYGSDGCVTQYSVEVCQASCMSGFYFSNRTLNEKQLVCKKGCHRWFGGQCDRFCGQCDDVVGFVWETYVHEGEEAAVQAAEQIDYELEVVQCQPNDTAMLKCIFAFANQDTEFEQCLADAPCHNDTCGPNGCIRQEHDICWQDQDKCVINPRCEVTMVGREIDVIQEPGHNVTVDAGISFNGGQTCDPCQFIVPIDEPGMVRLLGGRGGQREIKQEYVVVSVYGHADMIPVIGNQTDSQCVLLQLLNITVQSGTFVLHDGNGTEEIVRAYGNTSAHAVECYAFCQGISCQDRLVCKSIEIHFSEHCDTTDVALGNDCQALAQCVDDGRVQCQSPPNQLCQCKPETGQCECEYIHCHDCGCQECDDKNWCTLDSCNRTNGCCIHTPMDCNADGNLCLLRSCDRSVGCQTVWRNLCDDQDACTADRCDPSTGGCVHARREYEPGSDEYIDQFLAQYGKCAELSCDAKAGGWSVGLIDGIDDGRVCTTDSCDPQTGVIQHEERQCQQTQVRVPIQMCYEYSCSELAGGCVTTEKDCDDENPCTDDSCNPTNGQCLHQPTDCSDGDPCTEDFCSQDQGGCRHVPVDCDDHDPRTRDACVPANQARYGKAKGYTGDGPYACVHATSDCDDFDPCTIDYQDALTGQCKHERRTCSGHSGTESGNFVDRCIVGRCVPLRLVQGEQDWKCEYERVECQQPTDKCLTVSCDPGTGLCGKPMAKDCDDKDECTVDACNSDTGECMHRRKDCDDGIKCTVDSCDRKTGVCSNVQMDCRDDNACTIDECQERTGECVHRPAVDCQTQDKCVLGQCDRQTGECVYSPKDCDDGHQCTIDTCIQSTGECKHVRITCEHRPCFDEKCDGKTGECIYEAKDCDDKEPCTIDSCDTQTDQCKHVRVVCEHRPCFVERCSKHTGECMYSPKDCDDDDPKTHDSCDPQTDQCTHVHTPCPELDKCSVYWYDHHAEECKSRPKDCDDKNPCTTDTCDEQTGDCLHHEKECEQGQDKCLVNTCDRQTGECREIAKECDDGDYCTMDSCDPITGQCEHAVEYCGASVEVEEIHPPHPHPPKHEHDHDSDHDHDHPHQPEWMACENRFCDSRDGRCYATPVNCDDGNACTEDKCKYGVGCVHKEKHCDHDLFEQDQNLYQRGIRARKVGKETLLTTVIEGTSGRGGRPPIRDKCVLALCNPKSGRCYHEMVKCPSNDPRKICQCEPETGECVCQETRCANNDPCYVNVQSKLDGRCYATPRDCRDDDACTVDSCVRGECVHAPYNCDDQDACTNDLCEPTTGQCQHAPVDCQGTDKCMIYGCDTEIGCTQTPVTGECDPCEICYCQPETGEWIRTPKPIDDGDLCTVDQCVDGIVYHVPVFCGDSDQCTVDSCDPSTGQCLHPRRNQTKVPHKKCYEYACKHCWVRGPMPPMVETKGRIPPPVNCGDEHDHDEDHEHDHDHDKDHEHEHDEDHDHGHGHHHEECTIDEQIPTLLGAPCYPGYKFELRKIKYDDEECEVSHCDPATGERIIENAPDGTKCRVHGHGHDHDRGNDHDHEHGHEHGHHGCGHHECKRGKCVKTDGICDPSESESVPAQSENGHLSEGVIVAIVVGSLVGLLALMFLVGWLFRYQG